MDAEHFRQLSGGKPSRKCGIMSSGNHLFFSEDGLRMLVTNDMDLSNARYSYSTATQTYLKSLVFLWQNLMLCETLSRRYAVDLFSSSCVLAVVRLLQTHALSQFCCSSLWTVVSPGDFSRNFSLATAAIRLGLWPWRSHCGRAHLQLASAGGNHLRMDTFTAHGSLTRYMRLNSGIYSSLMFVYFTSDLQHVNICLLLPRWL